MNATTFAIGDRVRPIGSLEPGPHVIVQIDPNHDLPYQVSRGKGVPLMRLAADELERIDVDPEAADDAAVSASVEGQPTDDSSSTGATTEPAAEESPVPTVEDLAAQVATLTRRMELVEGLLQFQTTINRECGFSFEALHNRIAELSPRVDGTFRYLDGAPRTTKRVHTKVTKNTKGYGFELSAEVTSDDQTKDVTLLVQDLLDCADKQARQHIINAEYRDQHGLPGDDEIDPDQPF